MPKYQIRAPRFIDGHLIQASPQRPAVIELPAGSKLDHQLLSIDDPRAKVAPKPHFVAQKIVQPTAVEYFSEPAEDAPVEAQPESTPAKPAKGSKRAADTDVA